MLSRAQAAFKDFDATAFSCSAHLDAAWHALLLHPVLYRDVCTALCGQGPRHLCQVGCHAFAKMVATNLQRSATLPIVCHSSATRLPFVCQTSATRLPNVCHLSAKSANRLPRTCHRCHALVTGCTLPRCCHTFARKSRTFVTWHCHVTFALVKTAEKQPRNTSCYVCVPHDKPHVRMTS